MRTPLPSRPGRQAATAHFRAGGRALLLTKCLFALVRRSSKNASIEGMGLSGGNAGSVPRGGRDRCVTAATPPKRPPTVATAVACVDHRALPHGAPALAGQTSLECVCCLSVSS